MIYLAQAYKGHFVWRSLVTQERDSQVLPSSHLGG